MNDSITIPDRLAELRQLVHQHNHNYFVLNKPTIPDETFDRIFLELLELERAHPECHDPNSPAHRVGCDLVNDFVKVKHVRPMQSLAKSFSTEETVGFFVSELGEGFDPEIEVMVEPKIDGLSLSLHFENGALVKAVTRGDGTTGDDVTNNARTIVSIPTQIVPDAKVRSTNLTFEVRGEVYMTSQTLKELNVERKENNQDQFANPRNAAAGTMKLKDSREVARRRLQFIAYQAFGLQVDSHTAMIGMLNLLGFTTPAVVSCKLDVDEVDAVISKIGDDRQKYAYDLDGVVFKIASMRTREELGIATSTPRWAVAYKFPAERKATKLLGIELTVGRTGQITPNARIEPVQLAGTTVKNASLANMDEILRMRIDVGDSVIIQKAGEIIPQIVGLEFGRFCFIEGLLDAEASGGLPDSTVKDRTLTEFAQKPVWQMPANCPSCNSHLERDGVHYFCVNDHCKERMVQQLIYSLGKGALDMDGMGEAQIRLFVDHQLGLGPVMRDEKTRRVTLLDVYTISKQEVNELFKPAAASKFLRERERAKAAPLWRKLKALGIDGLGSTNSKAVAQRWSNIADIIDHAAELPGVIGTVNSQSFISWVEANQDFIVDLQNAGLIFAEERRTGPLLGKTFVITGTMIAGSRDDVSAKIENAGGIVKGSVGRKVDFLVKGPDAGQNKTTDAEKYGVKIIGEEELFAMLGEPLTPSEGKGKANEFEFQQP